MWRIIQPPRRNHYIVIVVCQYRTMKDKNEQIDENMKISRVKT